MFQLVASSSRLTVALSSITCTSLLSSGANEAGVVGGNEAINTLLADELLAIDGRPKERLLGMDLLRLSLERGTSAKHAMITCIQLLETHGQGGPCCNEDTDWTYENSFLFVDANEGYVLETAGVKHWAWERIEPGEYRNISNGISIRTNWGAVSKDIQSICKDNGWWNGTLPFDWKRAVGVGGRAHTSLKACGREAAGLAHLVRMEAECKRKQSTTQLAPSAKWWVEQMAGVLRDEDSGICFRGVSGFCSTGSQISWLPSIVSNDGDNAHFFSGASDPLCGTPYKLFLFSDPCQFSGATHDFGTKKLWNVWRERATKNTSANKSLLNAMRQIEEDSLSYLDLDIIEASFSTFEEMIQHETELLEKDIQR